MNKLIFISGSGYSILAATALLLMSNRGTISEEDRIHSFHIATDSPFVSDKKLKDMVDQAYGDAQQPYVLRQLRATVDGTGDDDQNQINRLFKFATVDAAPGEIEQAVASDKFGYEFYQKVAKETQWLSEQARSGLTEYHANTDWWAHGRVSAKALLKLKEATIPIDEARKIWDDSAPPAEADGPTSEKADFNPEDLDKAFDTPEEAIQKGSDGAAEATKTDTPVVTPAPKKAKTVVANKAKKDNKK